MLAAASTFNSSKKAPSRLAGNPWRDVLFRTFARQVVRAPDPGDLMLPPPRAHTESGYRHLQRIYRWYSHIDKVRFQYRRYCSFDVVQFNLGSV